jgi:site-specific DNA recombinase
MTTKVKPVDKPVNNVAAYLRVSKEDQAISGLGIAAQREKINAMCSLKSWPMPVEYLDDGVTGTIDISERAAGKRLLADMNAGKVDAVIVAAFDRIGRMAIYILNFIAVADSIPVVSCKELFDTTTPMGAFMVTIMAGIAQLERDTISQRTTDALAARYISFGVKAGMPPYGYRYDGRNGPLIDQAQAEIVRRVFALREQGLTLRDIADKINNCISHVAVKKILDRRDVYMGGRMGESSNYWPIILK